MRLWWFRLMRRLGLYLVERTDPMRVEIDDPVDRAVRTACVYQGLPGSELSATYDVSRTGKLPQVMYHAIVQLGQDHQMRTVGDIVTALKGTR